MDDPEISHLTDDAPHRRSRPIARRIARAPLVLLVWLWLLIDKGVLALVRPVISALERLAPVRRLERLIAALGPYSSLVILAVPFVLAEVPKLTAVLLIATGKARLGATVLVLSYLISLVVMERIFKITKPKLMQLAWFVRAYAIFVRVNDWAQRIVTTSPAWKAATEILERASSAIAPIWRSLRYSVLRLLARVRLTLRRER